MRIVLTSIFLGIFCWGIGGQGFAQVSDSVPKTGTYELNLPAHWKASQFTPLSSGRLLIAGVENDFDDYASLFFITLGDEGQYNQLFSLELPKPSDYGDFHLMAVKESPNGRIEAVGYNTGRGQEMVSKLTWYSLDLKGKILETKNGKLPTHYFINQMKFQGNKLVVIGTEEDTQTKVRTPWLHIYEKGTFESPFHQKYEPYWEINDAGISKSGNFFLCGYLPRHGAVYVKGDMNGETTSPKPGFIDGNAIQFLENDETSTLLVQGFNTGVYQIRHDGQENWHLELENATLSILGGWARRPGIQLKNGGFAISAARHAGPKEEYILFYEISPDGKLVSQSEYGPFEEAKACYIQELGDGTLRILAYIRDAWDWNLHTIRLKPGGKSE